MKPQLDGPPKLVAHRWGRIYPEHIESVVDAVQKVHNNMWGAASELTDVVCLEVEKAYQKGYQDGLAAGAALGAENE